MKKQTLKKSLRAAVPLASLGTLAVLLSGCGGASNNNTQVVATPDSGPVIYGVNALALDTGVTTTGETSSLTFTTTTTSAAGVVTPVMQSAIVGAINYKTVSGNGPLPAYKSTFPATGTSDAGVPLGFAPGGSYFNNTAAVSGVPSTATNLVFGIYVSPPVKNGSPVDINPSSIVLTSPESASFSLPIVFDPNFGTTTTNVSPTQYKTAPFAIPAFMQTTGLHDLKASIADVAGQSSTTDFAVPVVAPTDVALFLQSINVLVPATTTPVAAASVTNTAITPGDTVTIDGGKGIGVYPAGYTGTLADEQGTVFLFTTPGTHTVVETDPKGVVVQTETFTLDPKTTPGTTLLAPPTPDGAPAAALVKRVIRARRAIKH